VTNRKLPVRSLVSIEDNTEPSSVLGQARVLVSRVR